MTGNWSGTSLPEMWKSAQAADTPSAWRQVSAWQQNYELLAHHESRLKSCRDQLIYAWPPERSPAATAFIEYIDGLLIAIGRAKIDAAENHRALAGLLGSLSAARVDMAKLKAEWDEQEAQDANMAKNLPNDMFASGNNWQERLNERARARMTQNDQEVLDASRRMVELTPPTSGPVEGGEQFDPGRTTSAGSHSSGPTGGGPAPTSMMRPALVTTVHAVDQGFGIAGASLAGGLQGAPSVSPANDQIPSRGSASVVPGSAAAPATAFLPSSRPAQAQLPLRPGVDAGAAPIRVGPSAGHGRPAADPGVGSKGPGAARVGPVGGVIGGSGTHAGAGMMPIGATRPAGGGDPGSCDSAATLQWEVAVGGASVIEPEPERPFRLGPGVIGANCG